MSDRINAIRARHDRYKAALERHSVAMDGGEAREAILAVRELEDARRDYGWHAPSDVPHLLAEIDRLTERWIPVTERLPREDCIIYEANAGRVWFSYAEEVGAADWNITHWMPLPAAPEKGDSRELP